MSLRQFLETPWQNLGTNSVGRETKENSFFGNLEHPLIKNKIFI
jgi:hypothetical protein